MDYEVDECWQNKMERESLEAFIGLVPQYLWKKIEVVADRGFGKVNFLEFLDGLGVNYVIRVKGDVWVSHSKFSGRLSSVRFNNRKILWWRNVYYHKEVQKPVALLLKYEVDDPLYIVTNLSNACEVLEIYSHRMRIEEGFRDFKNERYFALKMAGLKRAKKMEKIILVAVIAYMFVILFGAVAERINVFVDLISIRGCKRKLLSTFRFGLELLNKLDLSRHQRLFCFRNLCPIGD
ncbi:MAG: transposase [candidate division WOR-3 bacterium]|nr:transposase [candidate division WOR-3 bacterium]